MMILGQISVVLACAVLIAAGAIALYEWGWGVGYERGRIDGANDARLSPLQRHPGDPPRSDKPMGHC